MKILLNFAGRGRFVQSQFKNSQTGLAAGFNVVYQMNESEIDSEFYNQNKEILDQPRGAGYWLWKPYFINRILSTIDDDDILFYCDSGSHFIKRMEPIFSLVQNDNRGVMAFSLAGKHLEKHFTKRDVFIHMNMNMEEYSDTPQRAASFMLFRGTAFAKEFVKEYLSVCTNKHLITDEPNHDGWIEPNFSGHRHDQSIWSLLTKKYNITVVPDLSQWGVDLKENSEDHQYMIHTRDSR